MIRECRSGGRATVGNEMQKFGIFVSRYGVLLSNATNTYREVPVQRGVDLENIHGIIHGDGLIELNGLKECEGIRIYDIFMLHSLLPELKRFVI